jgi:anti-sigma B factor antagonist
MVIHTEQQHETSVIVMDKHQILGLEAAEIQNTLLDLISNGSNSVAIDLSSVDYITSWGIGILIHAFTTCTNRDVKFYLTGVNNKVLDILRKVKLDKIFDIRGTD